MSVSWDASEFNALAGDLATAAVRTGATVAAAVRASAKGIEQDAKTFAPVLTGALRASITTTIKGDGRSVAIEAEIGPTVAHGIYVEYGTSDTAPQPFMGPAFEKAVPPFMAALEQAVDRVL